MFTYEKSLTPTGLVRGINKAAVSLFWNANMAAVTSCENAVFARVVVNSRLQHPTLKCIEKADAMLKFKVDDSQTSSRGSMSAIKAKD